MMNERRNTSRSSTAAAALLCSLALAALAHAQYIPPSNQGYPQQYPQQPQGGYAQQFDQYGRPINPQYDQNGQPIYPQYDQNGQPLYPQQYDQNGQPIYPQYDQNGQPLYPQQYDQNGQPLMPAQGAPGDQAPAEIQDATEIPDPLLATVMLGAGATARSVTFPSSMGAQKLDVGLVPALELQVGARVRSEHLFLGALLRYQTSIGAHGTQSAPGPDDEPLTSSIRTHRFEVGMLPGVRFSSSPYSVTLGLFAGYGLRGFASVVELDIPRYTLHGPLFRLELELPIADGLFTLRLAPEAQLIVSVSRDLRELGAIQDSGLAIGGEASARVRIADWAALQLTYRESHASADTAFKDSFKDVERFVLLEAVFRYY